MVRKKICAFALIAIILNISIVSYIFFHEYLNHTYLYPCVNFMNNFLFRGIVLFVCLSLGEAVLGVAIFLFRSSVKAYRALSYISIAITPVVIYILVGICLVFACGVCLRPLIPRAGRNVAVPVIQRFAS